MTDTLIANLSRPQGKTTRVRQTCAQFAKAAPSIAACILSSLLCATPVHAASWEVVPAESRIGFSGTHAGRGFTGTFRAFTAVIDFDPANLAASRADVTVDLASALTGDPTYDKTLPTADWFNLVKTPQGRFTTSAFKSVGGDRYEAQGEVELRGVKVPITFAFAAKIDGDTLRVNGAATVKRLDFGVGKSSDASGAWVSLDIPVEVAVVAKRK